MVAAQSMPAVALMMSIEAAANAAKLHFNRCGSSLFRLEQF